MKIIKFGLQAVEGIGSTRMPLVDLIKITTKLNLRPLTFDDFILPMLYNYKVGNSVFEIPKVVKSVPNLYLIMLLPIL
jgi:hypothetical protein